MKKLLFILIAFTFTASGYADEMPPEVKRLKSIRDKKVAKAVKDIDAVYNRELNKLKKKYAAQGNYIAAAYIEKMQVAIIDASEKETPNKDEKTQTAFVYETFEDPDKSIWTTSPDIHFKDGKAQAEKNSQRLSLKKIVKGDFCARMKVRVEGDHRYNGWDFYIHLIEPNVLGLIRFDHNGSDSILICTEKTGKAYPGCERKQRNSRGLEGTLEVERRGTLIKFRFINKSGGEIFDEVTIGDFSDTSIVLGLAGHPTSPRCIEEITIKHLD